MERDDHFRRQTAASNIKARQELDRTSKFWEKSKCQRGKALDRELQKLSGRLESLNTEHEISRHEFAELKTLLQDLERAENEASQNKSPGVWLLGNLVERHVYIEECRHKIERLLRRSHLQRHSEPASLPHHRDSVEQAHCSKTDHPAMHSIHNMALGPSSHDVNHEQKPAQAKPHLQSPNSPTKHVTPSSSKGFVSNPSSAKLQTASHGTLSRHVTFDNDPLDSRNSGPPRKMSLMKPADDSSLAGARTRRMSMNDTSLTPSGHAPSSQDGPLTRAKLLTQSAIMPAKKDVSQSGELTRDKLLSQSVIMPGRKANLNHHALTKKTQDIIAEAPELDFETLQTYYDYMTSAPSAAGIGPHHSGHAHHTGPHYTSDRNEKRKILAIEAVLEKVYDYRINKTMIHPKDALNCRYLRLTPQNVEQLEDQCWRRGIDPGLHAFSTEEEVLQYFEDKRGE